MRQLTFFGFYISKSVATFLVAGLLLTFSFSVVEGQDLNKLAYQARVNLYDNWNFDKTTYFFEKVIGKRGTPATAYSDYGWYLMLVNKFEEGLSYIQKAALMDPKDKQLATWNSWALLWDGNLPQAKFWINKALAIDPNYGEALYVYSLIASEEGNYQEAIRLAKRATSMDKNWRGAIPFALAKSGKSGEAKRNVEKMGKDINAYDAMLLVEVYAILGNDDLSMEYLQKAYELRHPFMPWLKFIPNIKHLHNNPRFLEIVKKMNLPK